jgi:predicted RNase H-like HicB family nuclease
MLLEYINKAMSCASYDKLEDGTYVGSIDQCPGVIAFGETLYNCQNDLQSSIEGWLLVKIRHGDEIPIIGRINLNKMIPSMDKVAVHG